MSVFSFQTTALRSGNFGKVDDVGFQIFDRESKEFFGPFGSIATVEQSFDKVKNERKDFFITFNKEDTKRVVWGIDFIILD